MKSILLIIAMCAVLFAQSPTAYNQKEYNLSITSFGSDSLKRSRWFPVGDYAGFSLVVLSPQKDSSKFLIGYERGYPYNGLIIPDYPWAVMDSFTTFTAGNFKTAASLIDNAGADTILASALDSVSYAGYVFNIIPFIPYRSPYARIVLKGITGNSVELYTVYISASLTKYDRVDIGTTKQPEQYGQ